MSTGASKHVQRANTVILRRTLFLLAVCGIVAFVVLVVRLYNVQVVNHEHFERRALNQQLRQTTITASRGTIFDRNGNVLAMSASVENVFISPREIEMHDECPELIANGLSAILGVDREEILERSTRTATWYQTIKRHVEEEEARLVREFISEHRLRGVHLEPSSRRYYPNRNLAAQILGFVGYENIGLEGLENRYENYLAGINGRLVRLRNDRGTELLFTDYEDFFDAQDGNNMTLTIDSRIQYSIENTLVQAIADYDVQNGAVAIVMDVRTGAILAMASYPDFDPNDHQMILSEREQERLSQIVDEEEYRAARTEAMLRQWRNRALSDTYEPGSVFKAITFAMALEENLVSLDSNFYCRGSMEVLGRGRPLQCFDNRAHGGLTLTSAMARSCNVATVRMALELGAETFYRYIDAFGLFGNTGLDRRAEGTPLWWTERQFFDRNNLSQLAAASFGQTFRITPIQMITAFAATINGGYLLQPYIVSQITDSAGTIIMATEPTVVRQVISHETSAVMRQILEDSVVSGTGRNARVAGHRIGGKTGTSENIEALTQDPDAPKYHIVSFAAFAPADDPQIAILLLMDSPNPNRGLIVSGGVMAAPVVGTMMENILHYLDIRPQFTEEQRRDLNIAVPRVVQRSVSEAVEVLESHGFVIEIVGSGDTVIRQLPIQHVPVAHGTRVILYTDEAGLPPQNSMVTVPDLSGLGYPQAKAELQMLGLFIRTTGVPRSDRRAVVSIQSIPPGTETSFGSIVEVTLIDREA